VEGKQRLPATLPPHLEEGEGVWRKKKKKHDLRVAFLKERGERQGKEKSLTPPSTLARDQTVNYSMAKKKKPGITEATSG